MLVVLFIKKHRRELVCDSKVIDHEFDTVLRRYVTSVISKFQRHLKEEWAVSRCVQASHFTTERYNFAFSYAIIYSLLSHLTPVRTFRQQLECQVPIKNNFGKFELFEPLVTLKIASSLIHSVVHDTYMFLHTSLTEPTPHTQIYNVYVRCLKSTCISGQR